MSITREQPRQRRQATKTAGIDTLIAEAAAALRVAKSRMEAMFDLIPNGPIEADDYEPGSWEITHDSEVWAELEGAYDNATIFVALLTSSAAYCPASEALTEHANENARNVPHLEGVILALMTVEHVLADVRELVNSVDDDGELRGRYIEALAARATFGYLRAALESTAEWFNVREAYRRIMS